MALFSNLISFSFPISVKLAEGKVHFLVKVEVEETDSVNIFVKLHGGNRVKSVKSHSTEIKKNIQNKMFL